jgi:hypothetical protein
MKERDAHSFCGGRRVARDRTIARAATPSFLRCATQVVWQSRNVRWGDCEQRCNAPLSAADSSRHGRFHGRSGGGNWRASCCSALSAWLRAVGQPFAPPNVEQWSGHSRALNKPPNEPSSNRAFREHPKTFTGSTCSRMIWQRSCQKHRSMFHPTLRRRTVRRDKAALRARNGKSKDLWLF